MTTIIGIKANSGLEGVVFGSDTQLNYEDADGHPTEKISTYKIIHGKEWLLADAGGVDKEFTRFQRQLTQPRRYGTTEEQVLGLFTQAVNNYQQGAKFIEPHFPKVNYLNTLARREGKEFDELHQFLVAVNMGESIEMWEIDEFGNLKQPHKNKDFEYLTIGSGGEHAEKYIDEQLMEDKIDQSSIDIPTAIEIAVESLFKAQRDPFTGGVIDLAVLTKDGASQYGRSILEAATAALKLKLETVKDRYRINPPNKE